MQLELFDNLYALGQEGYEVERTFKHTGDRRFTKLESTYSIILDGRTIMYVQDNGDGTYNAFGFAQKWMDINLKKVLKIIENKNNWCLEITKGAGS